MRALGWWLCPLSFQTFTQEQHRWISRLGTDYSIGKTLWFWTVYNVPLD